MDPNTIKSKNEYDPLCGAKGASIDGASASTIGVETWLNKTNQKTRQLEPHDNATTLT
jgi:hypothetical protein